MTRPKLYLETTIPCYLAARRSRDLRLAANQEVTEEWWNDCRPEYDLYISDFVLDEVNEGDRSLAAARLAPLAGLPSLAVAEEADELAALLLAARIIPYRAAQDVFHIAVAAVHGMDFLLTWSRAHIHNVRIARRVESVCADAGFTCPVICSPDQLLPTSRR